MNENLQVRWECSWWENSEKQEIKLLATCFLFSILFCFSSFSLTLLWEGTELLISLMALIFQNVFFLLANTSSEHDCTSRNLLLVIQFFTLFREQMESMLAKTRFAGEGVSLITYLLSTSTLSLVSSFKIFVGLERTVRLLVIAYSNPNGYNLELYFYS